MLSKDALGTLHSALEHPWLPPPANALPGSAGQIGVLLAALSLVQSPSALGTPWRSILLAQPIVEACLSIPTWLWFERGRNRAVARHAFAPLLPASIAWRASKGAMDSFVVEIFEANRAKATAMVLDGHLGRSGLIDRDAAERTLRDQGPTRGIAYGRVMQFVDVEAWLASWMGGAS
jgi:asparagine synthase (glutamine-hydrolysing)